MSTSDDSTKKIVESFKEDEEDSSSTYEGDDEPASDFDKNEDSDSDDDDDDDGDDDNGSSDDGGQDLLENDHLKTGEESFNDEYPNGGDDLNAAEENVKTKDNKSDPWYEGKEKTIAFAVGCCCFICLAIIGVIIGVAVGAIGDVGGNNNDAQIGEEDGPRPTLRPTPQPQPLTPSQLIALEPITSQPTDITELSETEPPEPPPTENPTISFAPTKTIPETLTIRPDQDTYVVLDGDFIGEEYGNSDTLLVQNGGQILVEGNEGQIFNSVGLISFPLDDVPTIERLDKNGVTKKTNALLRLDHFISPTNDEGGSTPPPTAEYTVTRLPETRMAIEYFHGNFFRPPEDDDIGVMVGPSFKVQPDTTNIDVDITSLLLDYSDKLKPEKHTDIEDGDKNDGNDYTYDSGADGQLEPSKLLQSPQKQLFLMISNRGPKQEDGGHRFYTRETSKSPQLLIDFSGGNPAAITISSGLEN